MLGAAVVLCFRLDCQLKVFLPCVRKMPKLAALRQ